LVRDGADLGVTVHGKTEERETLQTFYDGMPGWRWGWDGMATTTTETYRIGTLVIDLWDIGTKQALSRGVATDTSSDKQEKNDQKIDKAVEKNLPEAPDQGLTTDRPSVSDNQQSMTTNNP
jgi:hypothetical protein